jgi:CobQ-like glutamine amidotransferase family enzyme
VTASAVRIAVVYPELLGTYGDTGNARVLAQRLRWRGRPAEVLTVTGGEAVPESADVYLVGGGEDLPQTLAAAGLRRSGLHRAVDAGAVVLGVCAGLQILGTSFVGADGTETAGAGLVDCRTVRGLGLRAVGELVVQPPPEAGLPLLTGYENHSGVTVLGPGVAPAGRVVVGVGNGRATPTGEAVDGFRSGRVWGTYLHGPVLARNPALADLLLSSVVGPLAALPDPSVDAAAEALRAERLAAAPYEAAPGARGVAFPAWARRAGVECARKALGVSARWRTGSR